MNYRKTGIKLVLFGILAIFLLPYFPISTYIRMAITTFMIGSGIFLIFFGSFDSMD